MEADWKFFRWIPVLSMSSVFMTLHVHLVTDAIEVRGFVSLDY